jgi:hypothetical protein
VIFHPASLHLKLKADKARLFIPNSLFAHLLSRHGQLYPPPPSCHSRTAMERAAYTLLCASSNRAQGTLSVADIQDIYFPPLISTTTCNVYFVFGGLIVSNFVIKYLFYRYNTSMRIWDSSVGITTGYGLDRSRGRSSSPGRGMNYLFSTSSRPSWGPSQPPIQRIPGAFPRG